jgi:hypothetical protein
MRGIISVPEWPSILKNYEDFSFFHLMMKMKNLVVQKVWGDGLMFC